MITQEELKTHLWYDQDVGLFIRKKSHRGNHAGRFVTTTDRDGYVVVKILGKTYMAHRLAWLYTHGIFPEKQIDHKNKIPSDNRMSNLRECSYEQNHSNRRCQKTSKTGVKGVQITKFGKFRARIRINGEKIDLGSYSTLEQAGEVYMEKLRETYGEFASS